MKREISKDTSNFIYALKGLAIFSVVCAHCTPVGDNPRGHIYLISTLLNYIGTIGVPVLYIISGYLFANNSKTFKAFWKGKVKSLFIPWIFCFSMQWLYVVLRSKDVTFLSWGKFIIGYMTTAYYMTVLILFYLVFWIIKNKPMLYILFAISVFSMISTGNGIGINFINEYFGTYYLNPLNWMGFFIVGMLIFENKWEVSGAQILLCVLILASTIYFLYNAVHDINMSYFSGYAVLGQAINIGTFILVAKTFYYVPVLTELGKKSFTIYLVHPFIVGAINVFTNYLGNPFLIAARPVIVIVITMVGIWVVEKMKDLSNGKTALINTLIGLR